MHHKSVRPLLLILACCSVFLGLTMIMTWLADPANAQSLNIDLGGAGGEATGRIIQIVALVTVLSLAPSILIMMTSFIRIIVVLSFLRTAMGTQQTPPSQVILSLSLFLTFFVMMPTFEAAYHDGLRPMIDQEIDEFEAFNRTIKPFQKFMLSNVREQDLRLFAEFSGRNFDEIRGDKMPVPILIPAFMISELRKAFEMGFLLFLPFLIIDMVVSSVLMAMGMMMLPPIIIAMPFKIIFFVLVDGWYMVVGSLVRSFG